MENPQTVPAPVTAPPRRPAYFLSGVVLLFLGPFLYFLQFSQKQLVVPWYAPILGTLGVLLMLLSVWRRPGVLRIAGLVLLALFCGFEWYFVAVASKLPAYAGPAQPDHKVPSFATRLANGTTFTDKDLQNGMPTVLTFFRGHW